MPLLENTKSDHFFKDSLLFISFNFIVFLLLIKYDVLELLYSASRDYESLQLDEMIPLAISLSFSLLIFTYRRVSEVNKLQKAFSKLFESSFLSKISSRKTGILIMESLHQHATYSLESFSIVRIELKGCDDLSNRYGVALAEGVFYSIKKSITTEMSANQELIGWANNQLMLLIPNDKDVQSCIDGLQVLLDKQLAGIEPISIDLKLATWQPGESLQSMLKSVEQNL
ncbi:MAG: hypothetical protein HRU06_14890 [Oceanospirillaceae bacterium]|nr:hypothetical protein [Oceanospirillaceae bacterium]